MTAITIVFTLAKLQQSTKYKLKIATEMLGKGKSLSFNKAPERLQRCSGV